MPFYCCFKSSAKNGDSCKKKWFGSSLGTGDYGHLTVEHAPMLMRRFLSMTEYSQQGFEASHKDQRQLWLKASSHDRHGESSSSKMTYLCLVKGSSD